MVTFGSRLLLFLGVKHLGGMETALFGLLEILVTLSLSLLWLNESLTPRQWIGTTILILSTSLVYFEKPPQNKPPHRGGWLSWLRPSSLPPELPPDPN
jgi:drug/metabolite transporter (DMT)-like permease